MKSPPRPAVGLCTERKIALGQIILRLAEIQDVPAIMEIMRKAHEAMADPSAYILDDAAYVSHYVCQDGFVLLALEQGTPVGFFMAAAPGLQENNLGRYLGFSEDALKKTLMMDSAAVLPQAQGKGIMGKMFTWAVELGMKTYPYLVGTVAPGNYPSIRNFEKNGFTVRKTITKPGGQVRLLMGKGDLPAHES